MQLVNLHNQIFCNIQTLKIKIKIKKSKKKKKIKLN